LPFELAAADVTEGNTLTLTGFLDKHRASGAYKWNYLSTAVASAS